MDLRPDPPRMITVVIAIVLLAIGLALVFLPFDQIRDLIVALPLPKDLQKQALELARDQTIAYLCALASPVLLAIGSLLPGI